MSFNYLVAGGLGYAGSWIARHLARNGHRVFIISRGKHKPDLGAPYELVTADLAEISAADLAGLLPPNLHGVVHTAGTPNSNAEDLAAQSLKGTVLTIRNMLEALRLYTAAGRAATSAAASGASSENGNPAPEKTGLPASSAPLCIFFSTFHVYGRSSGLVTEETPPAPLGDYGLTHLFGEEYCRLYGRGFSDGPVVPSIILRPTNCWGAPALSPFTMWRLLINDLCKTAFEQGRIVLRGDPANERDFVWLGDAAVAVEKLLQRPDLAGRVFNLASGAAESTGGIADMVAAEASALFGRDIPVERLYKGGPAHKSAEPLAVDNTALRRALGIEFSHPFREEIRATMRFLAKGQS